MNTPRDTLSVQLPSDSCKRILTVMKIFLITPPNVTDTYQRQENTLISNFLTTEDIGYTLIKPPAYFSMRDIIPVPSV